MSGSNAPATERASSHWATVGSLRMHAWLGPWSGDGPAVVLVHGLGVSGRCMLPLIRGLAPRVSVAAPDLPGFGRSERPARVLDVAQLRTFLIGWMDAMRLESAIVLGHSVGAQVVVDAARRCPSRVDAAVLVGPTLQPALRNGWRGAWRLAHDSAREPGIEVAAVLREYVRAGPWRFWRTYRYAAEDRTEHHIGSVRAPSLLVRGERDPIAPQPWVEALASRLPDAELTVIPGAAHAVNYTAPDALAAAVLAFMERRL